MSGYMCSALLLFDRVSINSRCLSISKNKALFTGWLRHKPGHNRDQGIHEEKEANGNS
jgi:hypothetical protein